jgi:hypothetical protein
VPSSGHVGGLAPTLSVGVAAREIRLSHGTELRWTLDSLDFGRIDEDSDIALRQVFNPCYPPHRGNEQDFRRISDCAQNLLRRPMPAAMTAKMLLKPLDLSARRQAALERPLARITGKLFLR